MSNIRDALQQLDPTNDDHWTDEDLPRLGAVKERYGSAVSRDQINEVWPNFTRASLTETVPTPEHAKAFADQELLDKLEAAKIDERAAKAKYDDAKVELQKAYQTTSDLQARIDAAQAKTATSQHGENIRAYLDQQQKVREARAGVKMGLDADKAASKKKARQ